ncbi:IclR family transcriptional regulator [Pseudonocardia oroxyli]|uniref:Transcriptional regulator, IclR family n=1 Tax=Pseudonocardia oroxyli TaxID=366584 RepID=A0A1G7VMC2_PSEOR|nr:IclR family transcriptional regulator [Pseudonocardia oroxyli]SDG60935.1 transcriptional regulator, IclR family [Pseudonocardia oroxyli]
MSVAARVLDVLGAFTDATPVLTLTEISRRTRLPLTTTHRLVGELAAWGALERAESGAYRVGLRLWEVGSLAPRGVGLRERAMPYLEDLHEVTRHNVVLAVLDGAEVVYVERLSAHDAVSIRSRAGSRMPATATGVGLALLAHADPELVDRVLAAPVRRFTPATVVDPAEIRRLLGEVRRTGVAISVQQIELVSQSVGAPVRDATGVVAALSIVVPAESNPHAYAPAVLAAARGISRALTGVNGALAR